MQLHDKTVLLTGAAGGIGQCLAMALASAGSNLILIGRDESRLEILRKRLPVNDREHIALAIDLLTEAGRRELVQLCNRQGIDVLINNAGISEFSLFNEIENSALATLIALNLTVPMLLVKELLPLLMRRPEAAIVNIGSVLGYIGYPGFSVYGASKAGLRGFSEALRRELSDSSVRVLHVSPRSTQTTINSSQVNAMNAVLGTASDEPEFVAATIIARLQSRAAGNSVIGWPERFYVWLNAVCSALTDRSIAKHLPTIKKFAADAKTASQNKST